MSKYTSKEIEEIIEKQNKLQEDAAVALKWYDREIKPVEGFDVDYRLTSCCEDDLYFEGRHEYGRNDWEYVSQLIPVECLLVDLYNEEESAKLKKKLLDQIEKKKRIEAAMKAQKAKEAALAAKKARAQREQRQEEEEFKTYIKLKEKYEEKK